MNSKTLVRIVLAGLILLVCNVVLCVAILVPQRGRIAPAPTPLVQAQTTPTPPARATPTTTASPTRATPTTTAIPTRATSMTPTATPARPTVSPTPAELTSIADLEAAINAGRHMAPFRVAFSEQQITDELSAYLNASGDTTFNDVVVTLQPGVALITGKVRVLGFNISARATTTVVLIDGRPRLKVLQLDALGGLLPGAVKDRLMQMIEQQTDLPLLGDLPVTIDKVEIQTRQVVVTGQTK